MHSVKSVKIVSRSSDYVVFCTNCGKEMPDGAAFCPACGFSVNAQGPRNNQNNWNNGNRNFYAPYYEMKDTAVTIILGVLLGLFGIMGVGQIYAGKVGRGIAIMIGGFAIVALSVIVIFSYLSWWNVYSYDYYNPPDFSALIVIMIVMESIHIIYFIWQAYDAYKLAKEYNDKLYKTGQPPW